MQWWGYSLNDGSLLWGPTAQQPSGTCTANGGWFLRLRQTLFRLLWRNTLLLRHKDRETAVELTRLTGIGYESPYGNFPVGYGGEYAAADGKVFLYSTEHSPTQPLWRGSYLRAINANDGTELWKILNFVSGMGIADGYIVAGNNTTIRCTATARDQAPQQSQHQTLLYHLDPAVVIRGTVTDQSPGAKALQQYPTQTWKLGWNTCTAAGNANECQQASL